MINIKNSEQNEIIFVNPVQLIKKWQKKENQLSKKII